MTVAEVISQVKVIDGKIVSNSTGKSYDVKEFIDSICDKCKFTKSQRNELYAYFTDCIKPQTDASKHIEQIIEKYSFQFTDGVYILRKKVMTLDEIYRLLWAEEKLLPTEVDYIVENIEKISQPLDLQVKIFDLIKSKRKVGKSKYLESLDKLYPDIKWRNLIHNILVPKTKPLFHIFYDDGVGGTGKSTLLEVLTAIVGTNFTSNILLDQFGNRFVFANMLGKYLNVGDDNGKNEELQNIGTLKSIITGNRVTVDRKNISPIEVRIFAKQLYATNLFPYIDFTDGGIMRRLNVVAMNKIIPSTMEMCIIDENEVGYILNEILDCEDLEYNNNEFAITSHPLYMFYTTEKETTYQNYGYFIEKNGFRKMNIINFDVKSKFIKAFIEGKKPKQTEQKRIRIQDLEPVDDKDLPF